MGDGSYDSRSTTRTNNAAIAANAKAAVDAALSVAGGNHNDADRLLGLVSSLHSRLADLVNQKLDLSPYRKDVEILSMTIGKIKQQDLLEDTKKNVGEMFTWVRA